jgi:hypothetical protein
LEQEKLFKQFKLDEPWDGPHNIHLLAQMPKVYAPVRGEYQPHTTLYQVFDGPGAAFDSNPRHGLRPYEPAGPGVAAFEGRRVTRIPSSFPAGTARTLLLAEAGTAVPWTKPADLACDPAKPLPPLGGQFNEGPTLFRTQRRTGIHVVWADASVWFLSMETDEAMLRQLIARAGRKVNLDELP